MNNEPPSFFSLRFRFFNLFVTGGSVICLAALAGCFGRFHWFLDLFAHFRFQYAWTLLVLALVLGLFRQRRAALVFLLVSLLNTIPLAPCFFGRQQPAAAPTSTARLRVMLCNVNTRTGRPKKVLETVQTIRPDLLVLEEVNQVWLDKLTALQTKYPHQHVQPREDNFGIALLSRFPLQRARTVFAGGAVPTILAEVDTPRLAIVATHPLPPCGRKYSDMRNQQLAALPQWTRNRDRPVILVGDLNATPWSWTFQRLLRDGGLRDSARGFGLQGTWPAIHPLVNIPIDHLLHTSGVIITNRLPGPNVGSDHLPLVVDLVVSPK